MECARQGCPVSVKPSDLDTEGRPWAALISIIINQLNSSLLKHGSWMAKRDKVNKNK